MLDESQSPGPKQGRLLRDDERRLLEALLATHPKIEELRRSMDTCRVEDMQDGGMGSIRFLASPGEPAVMGKVLANAEYTDEDGVLVSITINADIRGNLFEMDYWKVDFSSLKRYPRPEQLIVKP